MGRLGNLKLMLSSSEKLGSVSVGSFGSSILGSEGSENDGIGSFGSGKLMEIPGMLIVGNFGSSILGSEGSENDGIGSFGSGKLRLKEQRLMHVPHGETATDVEQNSAGVSGGSALPGVVIPGAVGGTPMKECV